MDLDALAAGMASMPEQLGRGACGAPWNRRAMDAYMDRPNGHDERIAARMVCEGCPMVVECAQWIGQAEKPAGSWHGMYAGFTPGERRRAAQARADAP